MLPCRFVGRNLSVLLGEFKMRRCGQVHDNGDMGMELEGAGGTQGGDWTLLLPDPPATPCFRPTQVETTWRASRMVPIRVYAIDAARGVCWFGPGGEGLSSVGVRTE